MSTDDVISGKKMKAITDEERCSAKDIRASFDYHIVHGPLKVLRACILDNSRPLKKTDRVLLERSFRRLLAAAFRAQRRSTDDFTPDDPQHLYGYRAAQLSVALGLADDHLRHRAEIDADIVEQIEKNLESDRDACRSHGNAPSLCDYCGNGGEKLQCCSLCKAVVFCSKTCQKASWDTGHRRNCLNGNGPFVAIPFKGEEDFECVIGKLGLRFDKHLIAPFVDLDSSDEGTSDEDQ